MTTLDDEKIVLADQDGNPTGVAPKLASHHAKTPLHLAFSVYIFNEEGKLLVTQRALRKKVWPSVWTNSCCGHPAPTETTEDAIRRRVAYELGMTLKALAVVLPDYRYKTPPYRGIIENEICPIYFARADSLAQPNPVEVEDMRWLAWEEFEKQALEDRQDTWSWWCKDQIRSIRSSNDKKWQQYLRKS